MTDTICAISTPIGKGGISIIRISGNKSIFAVQKFFSSKLLDFSNIEPKKFYLGNFLLEQINEKCMMVYFKSPNSFTGEDIVEIQCHGGILITNLILQQLINNGCRLASAGEFSKRAFMNGKISLDESEGIIDEINAENNNQLKASANLINGKLKNKLKTITNILEELLAKIEVALDYPEEDLEFVTKKDIVKYLKIVETHLINLLSTSDTGKRISMGAKIIIIGKTNAGKSSLLNALVGYEKAIVTDINGTTRDLIECSYIYKDTTFNIIDTAGIRKTNNVVENIGITKAKSLITECDLIMYIIDGTETCNNEDIALFNTLVDRNYVVVVNKSDLIQRFDVNSLIFKNSNFSNINNINYFKSNIFYISTSLESDINTIKEFIYNKLIDVNILSKDLILTNIRHITQIKKASLCLEKALNNMNNNLDLVACDVKDIWLALGEITGDTDNERIIELIFSKFCVGK